MSGTVSETLIGTVPIIIMRSEEDGQGSTFHNWNLVYSLAYLFLSFKIHFSKKKKHNKKTWDLPDFAIVTDVIQRSRVMTNIIMISA